MARSDASSLVAKKPGFDPGLPRRGLQEKSMNPSGLPRGPNLTLPNPMLVLLVNLMPRHPINGCSKFNVIHVNKCTSRTR